MKNQTEFPVNLQKGALEKLKRGGAGLLIAFTTLLFIGLMTACKNDSSQEFQKKQNELFKPSVNPNSLLKSDSTLSDTTP